MPESNRDPSPPLAGWPVINQETLLTHDEIGEAIGITDQRGKRYSALSDELEEMPLSSRHREQHDAFLSEAHLYEAIGISGQEMTNLVRLVIDSELGDLLPFELMAVIQRPFLHAVMQALLLGAEIGRTSHIKTTEYLNCWAETQGEA
jgi:hypothetical protein